MAIKFENVYEKSADICEADVHESLQAFLERLQDAIEVAETIQGMNPIAACSAIILVEYWGAMVRECNGHLESFQQEAVGDNVIHWRN